MTSAAIIIATLASSLVLLGLWRLGAQRDPSRSKAAKLSRWVSLAIAPFAWFVGLVVGGNFGGGIGATLAGGALPAPVAILAGVAIGIFLVTASLLIGAFSLSFILAMGVLRGTSKLP